MEYILNIWDSIPYKEALAIAILNNVVVELIKPIFLWKMADSKARAWLLKAVTVALAFGLYSLLVWQSRIQYEIVAAMLAPFFSLLLYELKFYRRILNKLSAWADKEGFSDV